ncbi:hypothetical protein Tco_0409097 [Tanacetum coccineum]
MENVGVGSQEGPTEPAPLAQTTPSPNFIKENIDVLRTLIKEYDQQAKANATPKKLAYDESEEEDSDNLGTKGLRSERLENISKSKEKSRKWKAKSRGRSIHGSIQVRELAYQGCTSGCASRRDHPELAKKLNDKIPKTVDEIFERVRAFIRGEAVARSAVIARALQCDKGNTRAKCSGSQERIRGRSGPREFQRNMGTCAPYSRRDTLTPLSKTPKEILAIESVNFPPPPPLVFSTWMAFGGNTLRGDVVAGIKRCRRDLSSDNVKKMTTASGPSAKRDARASPKDAASQVLESAESCMLRVKKIFGSTLWRTMMGCYFCICVKRDALLIGISFMRGLSLKVRKYYRHVLREKMLDWRTLDELEAKSHRKNLEEDLDEAQIARWGFIKIKQPPDLVDMKKRMWQVVGHASKSWLCPILQIRAESTRNIKGCYYIRLGAHSRAFADLIPEVWLAQVAKLTDRFLPNERWN